MSDLARHPYIASLSLKELIRLTQSTIKKSKRNLYRLARQQKRTARMLGVQL